MNDRKYAQKGYGRENSSRMPKPKTHSYERRILERQISDAILLDLVAHYFRTHTIRLIRPQDNILKSWLDISEKGDIVVGYQLLGPPLKKEVKVKLTVYNGS